MTTALTDEDDKQHQVVNYNRNAGVCIVTMTVINVNSFRYDIMLGIDQDYDVSLVQYCIVVAVVGADRPPRYSILIETLE